MDKYEIRSGEFAIIIQQKSDEAAALEAIALHYESMHHTSLGQLTMVKNKTKNSEALYFSTDSLIEELFCPASKKGVAKF